MRYTQAVRITGHGDFAPYYQYFGHEDVATLRQYGGNKTLEHFFFYCRFGQRATRYYTSGSARVQEILTSREGTQKLDK
jgi:hypothetical protein